MFAVLEDCVLRVGQLGSGELHGLGPFGVHAPGILDDPAMRAFAGRVGDRVVSVSMAYVGHGVVGVYGVASYHRLATTAPFTARTASVGHPYRVDT